MLATEHGLKKALHLIAHGDLEVFGVAWRLKEEDEGEARAAIGLLGSPSSLLV